MRSERLDRLDRLDRLVRALFEDLGGPPGRAAFRTDAGRLPGLSYGHLARCHILSRHLRKRCGAATRFFMRATAEGMAHARALGEDVVELGQGPLALLPGEALIVDLPAGPASEGLDLTRGFSVVLDDSGLDPGPSDVVLNSSILAAPSMYPQARRLLLGPDRLILSEDFETARREPRRPGANLDIVATFGGSDPMGLTVKVLRALAPVWPNDAALTVVLGPGYADPDLEAALAAHPGPAAVARNPESLLPLFTRCDLALCAGGRTLYELASLHVPTLAVASIGHEAPAVLEFARQGRILAGLPAFDPDALARAFLRAAHALRRPEEVV